jgi:hypothetical protein
MTFTNERRTAVTKQNGSSDNTECGLTIQELKKNLALNSVKASFS